MKFLRHAVAVAAAAMLGLSACSSGGGSSEPSESAGGNERATDGGSAEVSVGFVPTTMNNPFWQAIMEGMEAELGEEAEIRTVDPQADQARMNDMVGDLIVAGVDVIVLAPYDTTGVKPALEAASAAGIPVVNIDTPVVDQDLVATVVASDNRKAGRLVAEDMMGKTEKGSKVAVIHCPAGQACIDRLDGFKEASGDYFTIVQELDGKGELAAGMTLAEDILQADPDVKAIFGVNDPMALGAVQTIQGRPEAKGVLVYGVDGSPDAKVAIKDGRLTGTGAQSPLSIGKEAAAAAMLLVEGGTPEKNIVVDTTLITTENIADFEIDSWQ